MASERSCAPRPFCTHTSSRASKLPRFTPSEYSESKDLQSHVSAFFNDAPRINPDLPEKSGTTTLPVETLAPGSLPLHPHFQNSSNGAAERSLRPHRAIRIPPVDPVRSGSLPLRSEAILPFPRDRRSRSAFRSCHANNSIRQHPKTNRALVLSDQRPVCLSCAYQPVFCGTRA